MFGIELTLSQKVSLAVVLVALGVSGVFITKAMRPEPDLHINAYTTTRQRPLVDDDKQSGRITATNPRDPKKDEKVLNIAVVDGMLEVTRFPNDASKHVRIKWSPERRLPGLVYQYYKDPMLGVEEYSDGFRHALAFATYKMQYEVPGGLGLLGSTAMTEGQVQQELAARTLMKNEIGLLRVSQVEGKFHPELLGAVEKSLAAYEERRGSPEKDRVAAELARKVLDGVVKYLATAQEAEDKLIEKYIMTMDKVLSDEQKSKFVAGYEAYIQKNGTKGRSGGPVGRGGGTNMPARGGANNPARGATNNPARGGATMPARGGAMPARGGTMPARGGSTTAGRGGG